MQTKTQQKKVPNGTANANRSTRNKVNGVLTSNPMDVLDSDVAAPDSYIINAREANVPLSPDGSTESTFTFLSRVLSIPFIHDTTLKAHEYASKYSVTRFVLEQTETTVKRAATIASSFAAPYAEKYKPQLLKADLLGCQSLDMIERKFPAVREPTDVMLNNVKEAPKKVFDEVKEKIVQANPVSHANDRFESLLNRWVPSKDVLFSSVKESPQKVYGDVKETILHLGSIPVSQANESLQYLLNTWLPEEDKSTCEKEVTSKTPDMNGKDNDHTAEEKVHKLFFLAHEMKDRLVARVAKRTHLFTSLISARLHQTFN